MALNHESFVMISALSAGRRMSKRRGEKVISHWTLVRQTLDWYVDLILMI